MLLFAFPTIQRQSPWLTYGQRRGWIRKNGGTWEELRYAPGADVGFSRLSWYAVGNAAAAIQVVQKREAQRIAGRKDYEAKNACYNRGGIYSCVPSGGCTCGTDDAFRTPAPSVLSIVTPSNEADCRAKGWRWGSGMVWGWGPNSQYPDVPVTKCWDPNLV
jgi:hypothetical protein